MDYYTGALTAYFAIIAVAIIVGAAAYVVGCFFLSKIFAKAGVEGSWRAWVPVYNMMVFFKLGDLSPWLVLYGVGGALLLSWLGIGSLFSLALFAASAVAAYRIGMKMQKEPVWVVLFVFLSLVWLGIMAFDKARWNTAVPPAQWSSNAFLGDHTTWQGVPAQAVGDQPPNYGANPQPGNF